MLIPETFNGELRLGSPCIWSLGKVRGVEGGRKPRAIIRLMNSVHETPSVRCSTGPVRNLAVDLICLPVFSDDSVEELDELDAAVGGAIGWGLDLWLETRPWLMLVLLLLGGAAGILNVYRISSGYSYAAGYKKADDVAGDSTSRDQGS